MAEPVPRAQVRLSAADLAVRATIAYQDALLTAGECVHGVTGGELVRPWCGTPVCAMCRRRDRVHWWRLTIPAGP